MKLAVAAVVALFVAFGVIMGVAYNSSERQTSFTVESKERVCSSSDDCRYLIFTDNGTYENTDTVFKGKFNSSDIYGDFKEGETYDVTVWGWRVPFLSMYPNILEVN